jgi:hypothetical protein
MSNETLSEKLGVFTWPHSAKRLDLHETSSQDYFHYIFDPLLWALHTLTRIFWQK